MSVERPARSDDRPAEAELPAPVQMAREVAEVAAELLGPAVDVHVAAMLANCRIALDVLAAQHARLADRSDLELEGSTRWAARWQLAGAAIAFAHSLVDQSAAGHVDSALPTSRTLNETLAVLAVIDDNEEETILDSWLAGEEIRPKKVRAAAERQAQRVKEIAAARGVDLSVSDLKQQMEATYSVLSDASHVRRVGLRGLMSLDLRRAVYGRHPDPRLRAIGAASTVLSVESTLMGVGDALASFYGGPYYDQVIKPLQDELMGHAAGLLALTKG